MTAIQTPGGDVLPGDVLHLRRLSPDEPRGTWTGEVHLADGSAALCDWEQAARAIETNEEEDDGHES